MREKCIQGLVSPKAKERQGFRENHMKKKHNAAIKRDIKIHLKKKVIMEIFSSHESRGNKTVFIMQPQQTIKLLPFIS